MIPESFSNLCNFKFFLFMFFGIFFKNSHDYSFLLKILQIVVFFPPEYGLRWLPFCLFNFFKIIFHIFSGLYSTPRSVGKVIGWRIGRKIGQMSQDNKNLNHDNFLSPIFGLHSSYYPSSYPSSSKSFSVGNLADEGRRTKVLNSSLFQGGTI